MDKKLNKIKVIIPFYNPGEYLDSCISSVLTQDYGNYEVLFIDDASTEEFNRKLQELLADTDRYTTTDGITLTLMNRKPMTTSGEHK